MARASLTHIHFVLLYKIKETIGNVRIGDDNCGCYISHCLEVTKHSIITITKPLCVARQSPSLLQALLQ